MALRVRRAGPKPSGPWRPGMRVIDDSCDRLGADLVRRLLESPDVLPEHERWTPTRWLMKAVYEAVHGKGAALSTLMSSLRSESDNKAHVVDLYRKLSADYASSSDEVSGAGGRAHGRCERSYVFSSQLRHWLHEIPSFVVTPTGWQPPPEPAAGTAGAGAMPLTLDEKPAFMQTYQERTQARAALSGRGPGALHDISDDIGEWSSSPWSREPAPGRQRSGRQPTIPSARGHGSGGHSAYAQPDYGLDGRRQGNPSPASMRRSGFASSARSGSPARALSPARAGSRSGRAFSPVRTFLSGGAGGFEGARAERLLGSLAAGIRKRLYEDLKRPHDLFRVWDRDEDGRVSVQELLAGCAHLGLAVSPGDEATVECAPRPVPPSTLTDSQQAASTLTD